MNKREIMSTTTRRSVLQFCKAYLPSKQWYEEYFDFVKDGSLKQRIINEFKSIRFAYKLYSGLDMSGENYYFEVRSQIISYATIYEGIIDYLIFDVYKDNKEVRGMLRSKKTRIINLPQEEKNRLSSPYRSRDGILSIVQSSYIEKNEKQVTFEDKCRIAEKLGLLKKIQLKDKIIDLPSDIRRIYNYRNKIHIFSSKDQDINVDIKLSRMAYRRLEPFLRCINNKLINDEIR